MGFEKGVFFSESSIQNCQIYLFFFRLHFFHRLIIMKIDREIFSYWLKNRQQNEKKKSNRFHLQKKKKSFLIPRKLITWVSNHIYGSIKMQSA